MINNIKILLLVSLIFFQSCATIFTPIQQHVKVVSKTKQVTIRVDNKTYQLDSTSIKIKLPFPYNVEVSKSGYKTRIYPISRSRFNPLFLLDLHPLFLLVDIFTAPPKKNKLYPKKIIVDELKKLPVKDSTSKYLLVKETSVDLSKNTINYIEYRNYKQYLLKIASITKKRKEDEKINNLSFREDLNGFLLNYGYVDNTNSIVKSKINTSYIKGSITNFKWVGIAKERMVSSTVEFKWEFFDFYGTKISEIITSNNSDFETSPDAGSLIKNALEYSLIDLLDKEEVKQLLKIDTETTKKELKKLPLITLNNSSSLDSNNVYKLTNAAVSIEKSNNNIGSGCIISDEGHIITTITNLENKDSVNIIYNGKKHIAHILRRDDETNICLLKADVTPVSSLRVYKEQEIEAASDIFVIASPNMELTNSITKGIVSAKRKFNNINYIQTDASLNEGNVGGAMLNDKGQLIGIIAGKLNGIGIEGLGFAIPSYYIFERLKINFSN